MSSPPTKSAPASCASCTLSPLAITSTRFDFPSPCGRTTVPRTIWSDCFGSTPRFSTSSTVSSNFTKCALRRSSAASSSLYGRASTSFRARSIFFPPTFALRPISLRLLTDDFDAHVPRGAHDRADGGFEFRGIQVGQLCLGDFFHLLERHFRDFVAVRLGRTFDDSSGALQKFRGRRRLGDERERAVGIDRDQQGYNNSLRLFRRLRVELLTKIHDVDAVRAKSCAHGRRRSRFGGRQLQFHGGLNFFRHFPFPFALRAISAERGYEKIVMLL